MQRALDHVEKLVRDIQPMQKLKNVQPSCDYTAASRKRRSHNGFLSWQANKSKEPRQLVKRDQVTDENAGFLQVHSRFCCKALFGEIPTCHSSVGFALGSLLCLA